MTSYAASLFGAAERLNQSPAEMLNGAAAQGLRALEASAEASQAIASDRSIDPVAITLLWERATTRLRQMPEPDELFAAAAEAATLLYATAWVLDSDEVTSEDVRALM